LLLVRSDRSVRIAVSFARQAAVAPKSKWCAACAEVLDVTGVGITLMGRDQAGPICVSNGSVAALEDLQFTTGEGPCRDAYGTNVPTIVAHLDAIASLRWPAFIDLATTCGIGGVFAYPMTANQATVGVLTVYQRHAGELTVSQHDDCLALCEVLAETILSLQSDETDGQLAAGLDQAVAYRAEIYQASGVVAFQLSISPDEALLRIRGHAFATGDPVATVAADVLAHRLWLTNDHQPETEV
jgi:hypothetical protein